MQYNSDQLKGKIQDFFIDTSCYTRWNSQERKKNRMEIQNSKCFFLFSLQKYSGHPANCFNLNIEGTYKSFVMQNPPRLSMFSGVLKPEPLGGGGSKQIIWTLMYM